MALGPADDRHAAADLAQSFNPIGSIVGVLIGQLFILSNLHEASEAERAGMAAAELARIQRAELAAVMGPYVAIAGVIVLVWFAIAFTRLPRRSDDHAMPAVTSSLWRLLRLKHYTRGVIAQFFHVGAQVGVWSFTIRYAMANLGLNEEQAASFYLASIIVFTISRFACTALMKYIAPHVLLWMMAGLGVLLSMVVILAGGLAGAYALVGISACMSLMFPTIYGLAVQGLGEDTKIGGAGLIMAILGGAVLTAVQARVSDGFGINVAYVVPLICFLIIAYYGATGFRPGPGEAM